MGHLDPKSLAIAYIPLARSIASGMFWKRPDLADDITSEAFLGLVQAASAYTGGPVNFPTFARHRIAGAILDMIRREVPEASHVCRADLDLVPVDNRRELAALEIAREQAEAVLARMPPKVARATRLLYLDGMNQSETAAAMGCSQAEVCRLRKLATTLDAPRPPRGRPARWMVAAKARLAT